MENEKPDLMELIPVRLFEWETDKETNNVIVIRPKFTSKLGKKLLLPLFGRKYFRIKLDALGSKLWQMADGEHTVGDILKALQEEFTEEPDLAKRLTIFVHQLVREKFIQLLQRIKEDEQS